MKRPAAAAVLLGLLLSTSTTGCATGTVSPQPTLSTSVAATPSSSSSREEPRYGGVVIISDGAGLPRHLNPALVSGSATALIGTQIFASPLRYDEDWNPQPYLAKSWSVSADGLSVTLNLVKGATFHDGRPITSEDVAFSLLTVKTHHPFKSMFEPVETIDTPDPYTAVIRLSHPHPAILLAMSPALLPIIPKHVYGDGQDLATHPANLAPIGSGPFKFVSFTTKSVVLERYDRYFIPGRPYLDGIVFRLESDPDAQMIDMERQEAHLMPLIVDPEVIDRLGRSEHLVVTQQGHEALGPINWLAFNLLREPLNDKRVRQAIAYAIDPDFVTGYLHRGLSRRATGPISPDSPFYDSAVPAYNLDLIKAGDLLDEAGYPANPDGIRFSLTLDYIPLIPSQQQDVALYLDRQLAQIGIDVRLRRSASFPEWAERIGSWDFDLTLDVVYNYGDPVIGVHRTYLCDNIRQGVVWSNTQNYCNPQVDELLNQAAVELDAARRKSLYSEFQRIVTEESPVVWINVVPFHTAYHAGLGNPPLSIWGVHSPLDELYWKEPPRLGYLPVPTSGVETSLIQEVGVRALALIQRVGLYEALEILRDPTQGYLDLEGSGLHVIGFTDEGIVFLDNSGQTRPGMNIRNILDRQGNGLLSLFLAAAGGKNDGSVTVEGVWPHPVTQEVSPMSAWCGHLNAKDVICVLEWAPGGDR